MCFFCAYFISGGTLTDMALLKRLRLLTLNGESRKKLKRGFKTNKAETAYESNFTVKMSGSLNMIFEDYFELYKSDMIETARINSVRIKIDQIKKGI